MSITYKVTEKGQPGVVGGGEKKFYATNVNSGEATVDDLITTIEKISTVSGVDISAVVYAFIDTMMGELSKGNIVRLGGLGSFRVSISSEGSATADEVNANSIKGAKILFTPGIKLKKMLNSLEYKKG